jgi:hypothetical protein
MEQSMMDRLLLSAMNFIVVTLIGLTGGAALVLGYWGLMELFNGQSMPGICALFAGAPPAVACLKLAKYRNDLVDRWTRPYPARTKIRPFNPGSRGTAPLLGQQRKRFAA